MLPGSVESYPGVHRPSPGGSTVVALEAVHRLRSNLHLNLNRCEFGSSMARTTDTKLTLANMKRTAL